VDVEVFVQLQDLYGSSGYLIVFIAGILEASPVSWIIPFSFLIVMAGFIAASGDLDIVFVILLGVLGQWLSLGFAYYLGERKAAHLIQILKQEEYARKAGKVLRANKVSLLMTSLIAGITRFWVAYLAGHERHDFWEFMALSAAASFVWISLVAFAGYLAGYFGVAIEEAMTGLGIIGWGLIVTIAFTFYHKLKHHEEK
jgi:membrane protein DedA with SNARE-associated domain